MLSGVATSRDLILSGADGGAADSSVAQTESHDTTVIDVFHLRRTSEASGPGCLPP